MNELITDNEIITEHNLAQTNAKSAVEHAVNCGRMLNERRPDFAHGTWLPWLESIGMPQSTAEKYMRSAKKAGDTKLPQHGNLTLADLLGEEKKTREKKVDKKKAEPEKKISWAEVAIDHGLMGSSAGGSQRKKLKAKLVEIEPTLSFPNGGLDREAQVVMAAACENLSVQSGITEKTEKADMSKREISRQEIEFEMEVQNRVREALQLALDDYNAIAHKQRAQIAAYKGIFTKQEYKIISGALHSDRYPSMDDVQKGRLDKAFGLVIEKKFELCGETNGEMTTTLPRTVHDLMARRK